MLPQCLFPSCHRDAQATEPFRNACNDAEHRRWLIVMVEPDYWYRDDPQPRRITNRDGYVLIKLPADDWRLAMCPGNRRWLLEHRAVMAQHLGRLLTARETVHHRNGIRNDNRIENLELWASSHPPGQRLSDVVDEVKW